MFIPPDVARRAAEYASGRAMTLLDVMGGGKDGVVWQTSRLTALKVHARDTSYRNECDAYIRLRDLGIENLSGFSIPMLEEFDDGLLAIEMKIVSPPFLVDFASAVFDFAPEWPEDEGHTLADLVRERFDERADEVLALYDQLADRAGIYLADPHRDNIKFTTFE